MPNAIESAKTLYKFRWLTYELVMRDLRLRYRGSVFGFAWTILNPLVFMALYTLIFSVFLRVAIVHFPLYLLAGLIPWTWLATALSQGTSAILDGRMYVGKTLFPTEVLIAVPVLSAGANFLFSLPVLVGFSLAAGVHLSWWLIFVPLVIVIQALLVQGIVMLAATINVFFRDIQQLVIYVITIGFYITPIFYTRSMVPAKFDFLVTWNPAASLVSAYQDMFYRGVAPNTASLLYPAIFAIVLLAIANYFFARYRDTFGQYV